MEDTLSPVMSLTNASTQCVYSGTTILASQGRTAMPGHASAARNRLTALVAAAIIFPQSIAKGCEPEE